MNLFEKIFLPISSLIFVLHNTAFAGDTISKLLIDAGTVASNSETTLEIESNQDREFATVLQAIPQKNMTGSEFKKHFEGSRFVKILNQEENHHGFQYKDGLCQLVQDFCPSGSCQPGGLYFTTLDSSDEFFSFGNHARVLEIPDKARVWPEGNKYKADKLFLCDRVSLDMLRDLRSKEGEETYHILKNSPSAEKYSLKMALDAATNKEEPNFEPFIEHLNEKLSKFIDTREINSTSGILKLYLSYSAVLNAAWNAAWNAVSDASSDALWYSATDTARNNVPKAARNAARRAAWNAARYSARYTLADAARYGATYDASCAAKNKVSNAASHSARYGGRYGAMKVIKKVAKKNWWVFANYNLIGRYSYRAAEWASLVSFSENLEKLLDLSLEAVKDYEFDISKDELTASFQRLQENKNKSTALLLSPITVVMKNHLEDLDD